MTLRGLLKGAGIVLLAALTFASLWYGVWWLILGVNWGKLLGVAILAVGFRVFIFILDVLFGRPPQFSNRPWERPWEKEDRPG